MPGHSEHYQARPCTVLAAAYQRVACRWERQSRSDAPDQFPSIGRREEEGGIDVTKSKRAPDSGGRRRLVDDVHNDPGDKVPVFVVVGYNDPYQAEEVRLKLRKLQSEYLLDLEDAVVAVTDAKGQS
jgi:hypothetical protein